MSTTVLKPIGALVRFAVPATVVMMLSGLFLVVDTWFIARLGTTELAGATLVFPVFMILLTALGGGIGIGISAVISRRLGRGGVEDAQACVGTCLGLGLLVAVFFSVLYLLLGEVVLRRASPEPALVQAALDFSLPIFLGSPVLGFSLTLTNMLRSERNLVVPSVMMVVGGVVNAVAAQVLMFGWGPVPALGLKGAGWATVAGFVASSLLGAWVMMGRSRLTLRPSRLRWDGAAARDIIRIALPTILTYVVNNVTYMLLAFSWAHFGTEAVAGYGLASRFEYVLILTLYGLGSAVVTLGGEELGAGNREGFRRVVRTAAGLSAGAVGVGALVLFFLPQVWFSLFETEQAVVAAGSAYFRVVALAYPFYALGLMYNYAYQTLARAEWGLLFGFTRVALVALPGVALAVWSGGSAGLAAAAIAASFALYGLLSHSLFPLALHPRASAPALPAPGLS
ncbi:MAG TPA: MATE family efflux transporter [Archangium sp.]|uniref:MATE family efflux transporter n=1 Tax=Archangium sp. TaxID=1872627 RepID=UPI002E36FF99|nr:MATE family efflux transporter [Archangium sp.]HEX5752706.1 MATE family efflux transporter [Archangium sp.]